MTSLVKSASSVVMQPDEWNIENWMGRVIRDELAGTAYGVSETEAYATHLNDDLREAMLKELSFKSHSEELAARALCNLANLAPSNCDFQYLLTHTLDESRHANNFAEHFYRVHGSEDYDYLIELNRDHIRDILTPLQTFFDSYVVEKRNYYCGVAIIAIVLEGVLAPSSELSEIKWEPFDQRAAQVQRSANIDEIRHLCVCAEIMKTGMHSSVKIRDELIDCIKKGLALWNELPVFDMLHARETAYQKGMQAQASLLEGYEISKDILLKETDQNQRIQIASQWSHMMQFERLEYLGIREEVENG